MSVVRWEEPPPHGNTGREAPRYAQLAAQLRAKPGAWAVIQEGIPPGSAAPWVTRIRRGQGSWAPAGSFEARCVGGAGRLSTVYARYVGEA